MLELKGIKKTYTTGDTSVDALAGVSVSFRQNEFVAILGQSGSGKTTMLNIIGGLDRYDSGDLIINGRSTKEYGDKDWDSYRNHSVGFVFQSYNLIPHQTVLSNVELALTLSGVSKTERRKRAVEVLEKVGLGDQLRKKPNQMSGGQMQRVAIARALVNNPDILLADEPTGALDSETSLQIMDLISEIAQDRLVIMVTHNPELANQYANRIISLKDGHITDDSNPFAGEQEAHAEPEDQEKKEKKSPPKAKKQNDYKKTSMSGLTALTLSFNNLLTKKGRTFLTSFAGSIGIIGIALILSLSTGMRAYIASIEKDALSSFPIMIESQTVDMTGLASAISTGSKEVEELGHEKDKIYTNSILSDVLELFSAQVKKNDLMRFKNYLESADGKQLKDQTSAIQYTYEIQPQIYKSDTKNGPSKVFPNEQIAQFMGADTSSFASLYSASASNMSVWQEMLNNPELMESQYDVVYGHWPQSYNEVVLVLDKNNEITDVALFLLGIEDSEAVGKAISNAMINGELDYTADDTQPKSYEYSDFCGMTFKLVLNSDYYAKQADGTWADMRDDEDYMTKVVNNAEDIKIVGVIRPSENATTTSLTGNIAYTSALTEYVINHVNESPVVKAQQKTPGIDILTNLPFENGEDNKKADTAADAEATTTAATTASAVSVTEKPLVGYVGAAGKAPSARFVAEGDDILSQMNDIEPMTEEEIYAYIEKNLTGEDKELMTAFVDAVLGNGKPTAEQKQAIIDYIDTNFGEMFEGKQVMGQKLDAETIYNSITSKTLLDKETKLKIITGFISQVNNSGAPSTEKPTTPATPSSPDDPTPAEPVIEKPKFSKSTYSENLKEFGVVSLSNPTRINVYPKNFEAKEQIQAMISQYNNAQAETGNEKYVISYTDMIGMLLTSVTTIINIVTYALIAFVAISLVVSSIMIGVITYISVLERTKEIGVLRSIGASKHDVSSVFNSETLIVGLVSGVLGIGVTLLLNIPINIIIKHFTGIGNISVLPFAGGAALIVISVVLTVVAGLIPSRLAAKKDPVVALRSE